MSYQPLALNASSISRCEDRLLSRVNVKNCVRLYTTAEEIGANTLKSYCNNLISVHWVSFK